MAVEKYRTSQGRKLDAPREWPQYANELMFDESNMAYDKPLIPADLGRDLHNALVALVVDSDKHWPEAQSALARYEREVGE
jgi:hypothetical protein